MSRVLPILFNGDMVRAILDGRKTVTRRLIKPQPQGYFEVNEEPMYIYDTDFQQGRIKSPYQPGDILYVRETWSPVFVVPRRYLYKVGCKEAENLPVKWRPSIHMPKEATRIWLKVKDVRVERLQEITHEQVVREGTEAYCRKCNMYRLCGNIEPYRGCFGRLWNSTIKKSDIDRYGWDASPWVWVIEFERCEKPEGWCV